MKLFPSKHNEDNDNSIYDVFGLQNNEKEQEQANTQIPWHCGWCQDYINGATTGICPACEEKYFPKKRKR